MNLEKLIDLNYLFDRYPDYGFSLPTKIFLILYFVISIIVAIKAGKRLRAKPGLIKKTYNSLENWGWTTGILGLLLYFFREANALYLGSRIWMLLLLVSTFIWLILIVKYYKKEIPKKEELKKEREEFSKYLPRQK